MDGWPVRGAGTRNPAHAGIATYDSPDRAVRAFMYLVSFRRNREILYETPRPVPLDKALNESLAREQIDQLLALGRGTLTEMESKALLAAFGIPTTVPRPAHSSLEAVRIAREVGYPVVMKVHSPQIVHKTEVHGVVTGVSSDDDVRRVFDEIVDRARRMRPDADVKGVTIQAMVSSGEGLELIVGAKKDPVFGAVMMVGAGGITAEVLHDYALELPPLNERLARRMLESLRIRPLFEGYRGRSPVDLDRLVEVLMRLSYLIADNPSIAELDVNPLLVTPDGTTALDARVILDLSAARVKPRPYSHLAIRPYPEEYVRHETLRDGTNVLLRPIQPEDEPLWHRLLARCSERSLWLRFRHLFKESTHEMATRFCFVDYDRTMAIVAEVERRRRRRAGVDWRRAAGGRRRPSRRGIRGPDRRRLARARVGQSAHRLLPGNLPHVGHRPRDRRDHRRQSPHAADSHQARLRQEGVLRERAAVPEAPRSWRRRSADARPAARAISERELVGIARLDRFGRHVTTNTLKT